ncbi:hypothetical protein BLA24_13895 [Streptomyces cinnamoneus]|uniref:DUF4190 domain-containing protein n=1 Tax=Streptomyces cinnamoneus TaxID=53446 RepID=A0A2G1XJN8_STRCJ|nr:DUF4190 domain-containing protein [Streptomyces cinnamoneus]PHQ51420.1 hypothetical protein BLA24_13895 [Streptomyces cinnamoneus]PPT11761.1 DUF4190 domain-containing protein [Streptomyces cinnamoneus]
MSSGTTGSVRTTPSKNGPAKVSLWFAGCGVAAYGNFATGIAWLNPGVFIMMAVLCALIAIVAGHIGRFRGRRLDGDGRGMALLGIVVGWLVILVTVVIALAVGGLIAGLAVLVESL